MTDFASRPFNRRQALAQTACGFGSLALSAMHANAAVQSPLVEQQTHHPARAKRMIFLFMQGGPSQVDTFDPKPRLDKDDGKELEFYNSRNRKVLKQRVQRSPWKFSQHGESGRWVSELFPHQARHVDKLCMIHSMHTEGVAHGPSTLFLHTGATNLIRPSMGSWITYGLGTENQSLPGFVSISPPPTKGGPRNYSNSFLPATFQGTPIGRAGVSIKQAGIRHLDHPKLTPSDREGRYRLIQSINQAQADRRAADDVINATIHSYELAYRMQAAAPEVIGIDGESRSTLEMYGVNGGPTDEFGRQCLMARRMVESGVRYVQVNYSDTASTPRWDQHSNLKKHEQHALAIDQPVAALLSDLESRGLLDDTLVWWGGEFGRTPFAQGKDGRDHNPRGFTVWLCGGGTRPGLAYGATDEFGHEAVEDRVHMRDLHATILHILGLDHERLTYRFAGRDFRLTDVEGEVVKDLLI